MYAIILAAGYATRLYPLTLNRPKALLKIGKSTILDHIVNELDTVDEISRIAVVSNDKFYENFLAWARERGVDPGRKTRSQIIVLNDGTNNEETRLGAIGDITFAIDTLGIDEDTIVIAGDNFFTYKLTDIMTFYRKENADTILVKRFKNRADLVGMGVAVTAPDGQVLECVEKPKTPASDLGVFATYFYRKDTIPLFKRYLSEGNPKDAPGHFPAWLCKRKRVLACAFDGECYDVGTPEAYTAICEQYGGDAADN